MKHTELPWNVDAGYIVGLSDPENADTVAVFEAEPSREDAEFIVKAVNNHDALVEAINTAVEIIRDSYNQGDEMCASDCQAVNILERALAKSKGDQ